MHQLSKKHESIKSNLNQNVDTNILNEIDNFLLKIDDIFSHLWENYNINLSEFINDFISLQKEYQNLLKNAGEALGFSLEAILGAINIWLETKNSDDETVKKAGKWGAIALGAAGTVAAGYSLYQMYNAQKKINELKEKIPQEIARLQNKKWEIFELKIKYLYQIEPYIKYFKQATLIIIDILYSLAEVNSSTEDIILPRLDKTVKYFLKFEFVLQTIAFLTKNKRVIINSSFFNPGIPLYIKEQTLTNLQTILIFLKKKYKDQFNTANKVIQRILSYPFMETIAFDLSQSSFFTEEVENDIK